MSAAPESDTRQPVAPRPPVALVPRPGAAPGPGVGLAGAEEPAQPDQPRPLPQPAKRARRILPDAAEIRVDIVTANILGYAGLKLGKAYTGVDEEVIAHLGRVVRDEYRAIVDAHHAAARGKTIKLVPTKRR